MGQQEADSMNMEVDLARPCLASTQSECSGQWCTKPCCLSSAIRWYSVEAHRDLGTQSLAEQSQVQ